MMEAHVPYKMIIIVILIVHVTLIILIIVCAPPQLTSATYNISSDLPLGITIGIHEAAVSYYSISYIERVT